MVLGTVVVQGGSPQETRQEIVSTYLAISKRFVACPRWIRSIAPISMARSWTVVGLVLPNKEKTAAVFRSVVKYKVNLSGLNVKKDFWVFPLAKTLKTCTPSNKMAGTRTFWSAFLKLDLRCRDDASCDDAKERKRKKTTSNTKKQQPKTIMWNSLKETRRKWWVWDPVRWQTVTTVGRVMIVTTIELGHLASPVQESDPTDGPLPKTRPHHNLHHLAADNVNLVLTYNSVVAIRRWHALTASKDIVAVAVSATVMVGKKAVRNHYCPRRPWWKSSCWYEWRW